MERVEETLRVTGSSISPSAAAFSQASSNVFGLYFQHLSECLQFSEATSPATALSSLDSCCRPRTHHSCPSSLISLPESQCEAEGAAGPHPHGRPPKPLPGPCTFCTCHPVSCFLNEFAQIIQALSLTTSESAPACISRLVTKLCEFQ